MGGWFVTNARKLIAWLRFGLRAIRGPLFERVVLVEKRRETLNYQACFLKFILSRHLSYYSQLRLSFFLRFHLYPGIYIYSDCLALVLFSLTRSCAYVFFFCSPCLLQYGYSIPIFHPCLPSYSISILAAFWRISIALPHH